MTIIDVEPGKTRIPRKIDEESMGDSAVREALPEATLAYVLICSGTFAASHVFKMSGHPLATNAVYVVAVLAFAGFFVNALIQSANLRTTSDQNGVGGIISSFRVAGSLLYKDKHALYLLACVVYGLHHFFREEEVKVKNGNLEWKDVFALLEELNIYIAEKLDMFESVRLVLLQRTGVIFDENGGIGRRRAHRLVFDRYLVNRTLGYLGISMVSLVSFTNDTNPAAGQVVTIVLTFAISTAIRYIQHMESGLGTNPGDIKYSWIYNRIMDALDRAYDRGEVKPEDRPWTK